MRIVGGRWRGRRLVGPDTDAIRPTSDRLRETIFNVLVHAYGDPVQDARVLDLFAGTGGLGLEALSRGAGFVVFVESAAEAGLLIGRNVAALGAERTTRILRQDATRLRGAPEGGSFSLVVCDPPYGRDLAGPALASGLRAGWLGPDALVVVEEAAGTAFAWPAGFVGLERRRVGAAEIAIGRVGVPA